MNLSNVATLHPNLSTPFINFLTQQKIGYLEAHSVGPVGGSDAWQQHSSAQLLFWTTTSFGRILNLPIQVSASERLRSEHAAFRFEPTALMILCRDEDLSTLQIMRDLPGVSEEQFFPKADPFFFLRKLLAGETLTFYKNRDGSSDVPSPHSDYAKERSIHLNVRPNIILHRVNSGAMTAPTSTVKQPSIGMSDEEIAGYIIVRQNQHLQSGSVDLVTLIGELEEELSVTKADLYRCVGKLALAGHMF